MFTKDEEETTHDQYGFFKRGDRTNAGLPEDQVIGHLKVGEESDCHEIHIANTAPVHEISHKDKCWRDWDIDGEKSQNSV